MKRIIAILTALFLLSGCADVQVDTDKISVCTSFYAVYNFTKMITGDRADVKLMIPDGVEAHDWEPGVLDMIELNKADVFIYNGMGMEPWVEKIISGVENANLIVVEASEGVLALENNEHTDPHIWLDPKNVMIELENICDALILADSENADFYKENLEASKQKLLELDKEFSEAVSGFDEKEIVVTHGAFSYLSKAYGIEQYMIEGISGESDPSSAAMRDAIERIKSKENRAIFYVASESDKVAKVIADEADAKVYPLNPFENGASGSDYFEVMRENLLVLKEALK